MGPQRPRPGGGPTGYARHGRDLPQDVVAARVAADEPSVIRREHLGRAGR